MHRRRLAHRAFAPVASASALAGEANDPDACESPAPRRSDRPFPFTMRSTCTRILRPWINHHVTLVTDQIRVRRPARHETRIARHQPAHAERDVVELSRTETAWTQGYHHCGLRRSRGVNITSNRQRQLTGTGDDKPSRILRETHPGPIAMADKQNITVAIEPALLKQARASLRAAD